MARSELIRPLSELLRAHAGRRGDKVAFSDGRREVTYAELEARTARLAGHLVARGLTRGGRVVIWLDNSVEVVEGYLTAVRAGGVGVPVHPRSSDAELAHILEDSGAEVVITGPAQLAQLRRVTGTDGPIVLVTGSGTTAGVRSFEELATTEPAEPARDDTGLDDVAWMLYTSGTTGKPKGVLSTQGGCLWSVAACYVPLLGLSPRDKVLWPLPMSHSLAHVLCVHGVVASGATAMIADGFAGEDVIRLMQEDDYTFLVGVPTMYHDLLRQARGEGLEADSLRVCMVTGAVTSASLSESFEDTFGVRLVDSYGSTETCGAITMSRPSGALVPGSCGSPVPGLKVRVTDQETGAEVERGGEGEVWVKGPNLMVGYHDQPEATAAALREGWYRTGDLARQDELGYLTITGRIKELIIRGGENIHPAEVEDVIRAVPGVVDVGVAGLPDEALGEVPVAYVVPETAGVVDAARIIQVCRERLSYFKVPAAVYEVVAIPRTASGKVTRRRLLDEPARRHHTGGRAHEALFRLDWVPVPASPVPGIDGWAVLGEDDLGLGLPLVEAAEAHTLLVPCFDAVEPLTAADRVRGLAGRYPGSRLVFLTRGAVATTATETVTDPANAPIWGVVRSMRAAHDRLSVLDVGEGTGAEIIAAVATGGPQLAIRDGVLRTPRLAPVRAAGEALDGDAVVVVVGDVDEAISGQGVRRVVSATDLSAVDRSDHAAVVYAAGGDPHTRIAELDLVAEFAGESVLVLFTDADSVLGGEIDAENAAADAYLTAFAQRRRAEGLPTVTIAWRRDLSVEERTELFGLGAVAEDTLVIAARPDAEMVREFGRSGAQGARADGPVALRERFATLSRPAQTQFLLDLVRTETAGVLGFADAGRVPARRSFKEFGFDSKSAVELRNRLAAATGLSLGATLVFDRPTPLEVAEHLRTEVLGVAAETAVTEVTANHADEPIAIVGMACRLPGGIGSPEELWELVAAGGETRSGFPDDRGWDLDGLFDPDPDNPGTSYVRQGGFLDGAGEFDAGFFGISPREALAMDPQQRLLLEVSWEALERSGIDPASVRGSRTGVFAGVMFHDYASNLARVPDGLEGYLGTGNAGSVVSGRIAYTLGLEGPAMTVDTACSSSLVALHLAAQALRSGECSLALAGGVAVMATPEVFVEFSRQRGLAADGRCKSFAEGADGTAWSEGVSLLVVERLSDALRNGHQVLAIVRGSAVNSDGASNGLTAPSGPSQERVIRQALGSAGLRPSEVDAVEAHGTGTTLGDPIEARAVLATYGQDRETPLLLGSIKSNIGHAQAAAGATGVIKMVMALRHGMLPRTLHVNRPTQEVEWSTGAVELLTDARDWPETDRPRRAAVSSFGVSGTNAHVILEQAPPEPHVDAPVQPAAPATWLVSGRSEQAVQAQAGNLLALAEEHEPADLGRALAATRAALEHRAAAVGTSREELVAGLRAIASGEVSPTRADVEGQPVFVFPGQGSQWSGMAVDLLETSPVFAEAFDDCTAAIESFVDWRMAEELRGGLDRVDVVQPVLFAVLVSLAKLWRHHGVEPAAVVGHSQGEIAAACVAGALSLEDAARVVTLRSRLIAEVLAGRGGMVSVAEPVEAVRTRIERWAGRISVAAVNGPASTVVSGEPGALAELVAACTAETVRAKTIPVDYASHSAQVTDIRERLLEALAPITPLAPEIPILSTVTGEWVDRPAFDAEYWYTNLRETVRFGDAVKTLTSQGYQAFIEVSPHPVLTMGIEEIADDRAVLGTLRRDEPGRFSRSLAEAHNHGLTVDWSTVFGAGGPRIALPTYAFQHERYWLESGSGGDSVEHPLLDSEVPLAGGEGLVLTGRLSTRTHSWLADHVVLDSVIAPGSLFVELALHAGRELGCHRLEELALEEPLVLSGNDVLVQIQVAEDGRAFSVHSRAHEDGPWVRHARGELGNGTDDGTGLEVWPPAGAEPVAVADLYDVLAESGLGYGPAFHGLRAAWRTDDDVFAEVHLPQELRADAARFGLHPAVLDAALHGVDLGVLAPGERRLAFAWSGVTLHATGASVLRVRLRSAGADAVSLVAADETGAPVLSVDSLMFRAATAEKLRPAAPGSLFRVDWIPAKTKTTTERWALLGTDELRLHDWENASNGAVPVYPALDAIDEVPEAVVVTCPAGHDYWAGSARELLAEVSRLIRAWLAEDRFAGSRLVFVTRGAVDTTPGVMQNLSHAPIWGLVRTAQSEHPGRFVLLDVDGEDESCWRLPAALAVPEPQLAIRSGRVFLPRLTQVTSAAEPVVNWGDGTVLVTGASGGLGRLVARHLVERHGVADLLLLSRSGAEELAAELTELGADAIQIACDVADRKALADALAGHRLTAVVHTAGVVDDGVVEALTGDQFDRVLRPKLDGALNLHELTGDLDAFVLFSSAATTFGAPGQGNYAAANAFLDGLARYRRARGLPAVSLAWGLWAESGGMGGRLGETDLARMARGGTLAMSEDEALAMLDAATALGEPNLVPVKLDTAALAKSDPVPELFRGLVRSKLRRAAEVTRTGSLSEKLATLPAGDRDGFLLDLVLTNAAAVLGHEPGTALDTARSFKDLGFDSLTAVEFRNRLGTATGLRLPPTLIFNYPTPEGLTAHLVAELLGTEEVAVTAPTGVATAAEPDDPIAIVAMSCRFPGGIDSPESLWNAVAEEADLIGPMPADRGWDLDRLFDADPDAPGKSYLLEGGFIENIGDFDAEFFGVNPREALAMDPQQRLLLETAWEVLERAGIDPVSLRGAPVGVFAGTHGQDYGSLLAGAPSDLEGYKSTGVAASVFSGRLSYTFGFVGPAVTVDTACSASLVALHQAAKALRDGDCTMALVGAASIISTPEPFVMFSRQRALSVDGRCKSFAAGANGTGMSEGVGMLLMERLSDARRNGHPVLAIVRGSAVNSDGASNGLTAPNGPSQERVVRQALANAGLSGKDIDVVEAHGTGTALGDPIEAHALLATYGQDREEDRPLWLGSVKSNLGHTQAAAGLAGVIKMVEAMRHGTLPRTLHVDEPTPQVDWSSGGVEVLAAARAWPVDGRPRRAGVSSFGISGTNAHVILEQAESAEPVESVVDESELVPWVLSARSEAALLGQAARLRDFVDGCPGLNPADAGFSLATTRAAHPQRAAVLGRNRAELLAGLTALAEGTSSPAVVRATASTGKVAFVFPGQGSQWREMALELLDSSPVFADQITRCDEALRPFVDFSVLDVLRCVSGAPELERLSVVQPVLFSMMVSLAELWRSLGVRPAAVIGHSQGEVAAAHVAGALSLADAARVVALRSKLIDELLSGKGGVVSVALSAAEIEPHLVRWGDRLSVAAVNGPAAVAVAGEPAALDELMDELAAKDIRARRIRGADAAGHTAQVEVLRERLLAELAPVVPRESEIPFYSTVTGAPFDTTTMDAAYWYRNAREPVLFENAVRALAADGYTAFVESSPHPVLLGAIQETVDGVAGIGTLRRDEGGRDRFLRSVAEAGVQGVEVGWTAVFPAARKIELPTYAFQRQHFWLDVPAATGDVTTAGLTAADHPLLSAAVAVPSTGGYLLTGRLSGSTQPWLADHVVGDANLVPAAVFVELALRAGEEVGCDRLAQFTSDTPLVLPAQGGVAIQVVVGGADEREQRPVTVYAQQGESWTLTATGILTAEAEPAGFDLAEWPPAGATSVPVGDFYDETELGPVFQGLTAAWRRGAELFAEVDLPSTVDTADFALHPALLEAALHGARLLDAPVTALPAVWREIRLHATAARKLRVRLGVDDGRFTVEAADETGSPVLSVAAVELRPAEPLRAQEGHGDALFRLDWTAVPSAGTAGQGVELGADYEDLAALAAAIDSGTDVPPYVVARVGGANAATVAEAAREHTVRTLELVKTWLADERFTSARLVVLTSGAVSTGHGDGAPDLAQAPVWGLMRSAQSENPDRLILVDLRDQADGAAHEAAADL
ncbi:type I polyketide synthase, partial [Amycolatopsis pittospori]|uniref:type I polyketide synthase n=1 Tax=Amycolatopsis pittospori TaxID=2749434 RepID=UPI001F292BF9